MAKKVVRTKKYRIKKIEEDEKDEIEEEQEETNPIRVLNTLKVIGILFLIATVFHGVLGSKSVNLPISARSLMGGTTYKVEKGDTLWTIVENKYPKENPIKKIKEIRDLNHLRSDTINSGQVLKLP